MPVQLSDALLTGFDFALDADGDLDLSTGDLRLTTGAESVSQAIRLRLTLFLGEWFRDINEGVPWEQEILGQKPTSERVYAIFRQTIVNTPGVESLASLNIDLDASRVLRADWEVLSEYGNISDSLEL